LIELFELKDSFSCSESQPLVAILIKIIPHPVLADSKFLFALSYTIISSTDIKYKKYKTVTDFTVF